MHSYSHGDFGTPQHTYNSGTGVKVAATPWNFVGANMVLPPSPPRK